LVIWFFAVSAAALSVAVFRPFHPDNGYLFCRWVCPFALRILGIKLEIRNRTQLYRSQPCVFISNHQHLIDLFVFGIAFPKGTVAIGKRSLRWVPLFGWLFWLSGELLIDRSNRKSAVATMQEAGKILRERGLSVWVCPEGTRSRGRGMLPFKKGAFYLAVEARVPLQPYVVSSYHRCIDLNRWRSGTVIVDVLEPIPTGDRDSETLLEESYAKIKDALNRLDEEAGATGKATTRKTLSV
jgi:1-acyl-sn-glycerol-3-phosphate acyltransferase